MNTLDIILINTISYMTGIFTGLLVSYKLRSNKNIKKDDDNNDNNNNNINSDKSATKEKRIVEREYHDNHTDKYRSPLQTSMPYPSAPPPPLALNPEYMNDKSKKITITTE